MPTTTKKRSRKGSSKRARRKVASKKKRTMKGGVNNQLDEKIRKAILKSLRILKEHHNKLGALLKGIKRGNDTIVRKLKKSGLDSLAKEFVDKNGKVKRYKEGKNSELQFQRDMKKVPEKYQEGVMKDFYYVENLWDKLLAWKDESSKDRSQSLRTLVEYQRKAGGNKMAQIYRSTIDSLNKNSSLDRFANMYAPTYGELKKQLEYGMIRRHAI